MHLNLQIFQVTEKLFENPSKTYFYIEAYKNSENTDKRRKKQRKPFSRLVILI